MTQRQSSSVRISNPTKGYKTAVIFSDVHIPHQSNVALDKLLAVIKDEQPDVIIANGDIIDCYLLSTFNHDPNRLTDLQDEINICKKLLTHINKVSPKSRKVYIAGNHEQRLLKRLWELDGPQRALLNLDVVRTTLTWKHLLDLKNLGWEYYDEHESLRQTFIPNMIVTHGNTVRKGSGNSVRAEFDKYISNICTGHTHRAALLGITKLNKHYFALENGCLCDINQCDYNIAPDWQNAFSVVRYTDKEVIPELRLL